MILAASRVQAGDVIVGVLVALLCAAVVGVVLSRFVDQTLGGLAALITFVLVLLLFL